MEVLEKIHTYLWGRNDMHSYCAGRALIVSGSEKTNHFAHIVDFQ